jgi:hypothetical protein
VAKFHKSGLMLTKMRIPNFKDKYHVIWFPWREILTLIVSILTKFIKLNMRPNFFLQRPYYFGWTHRRVEAGAWQQCYASAFDRSYLSEQPGWLPAGQDPVRPGTLAFVLFGIA